MALLEIPIDVNQPDHEFYLDLEKVVYLFHFKLNSRTGRWIMDIKSEDGVLLAGAIPLVVNWALTDRFVREDLPPGSFWVFDLTGKDAEPSESSFGTTHVLLYEESEAVNV